MCPFTSCSYAFLGDKITLETGATPRKTVSTNVDVLNNMFWHMGMLAVAP
jgi:hypothetical protein